MIFGARKRNRRKPERAGRGFSLAWLKPVLAGGLQSALKKVKQRDSMVAAAAERTDDTDDTKGWTQGFEGDGDRDLWAHRPTPSPHRGLEIYRPPRAAERHQSAHQG